MERRRFLKTAAATTGLFALMGCGGSDESEVAGVPPGASPSPPAPPPAPNPPLPWNVTLPAFPTGTSSSFDLASTLPAGVMRGGEFGISASGATLPAGMTLSASGILSVGNATVGTAVGVIFTYAEPAA